MVGMPKGGRGCPRDVRDAQGGSRMVEDFLQFFINRLLEQTESIFFVQTETGRLFLLSNDLHEEIKELSRVAMVKN